MSKPVILDACCGGRMFWIDKKNPKVLFCDIRQEPRGHIKHEINHEVRPDILSDFTNMSFRNNSFKMVVFDPPHLYKAGTTGIIGKKYGVLDKNNWKEVIKKGFAECWRVLDVYGTLIFKWNVRDIPLKGY